MVDPVLSPGDYALGMVWIALAAGAVIAGAVALRRTFLAGWPRLASAVAVAITALATTLVVAELLGALGLLRWGFTLLALGAAGATEVVLARRWRERVKAPPGPVVERSDGPLLWLAALPVAGVLAQWATHVADALGRGMTHADTLWYHGPYSAFFLQTASLGDVGLLGQEQTRYYPLSSELLHTLVAMPFSRDVLSPFVNLGFALLALAAAAVLGARWGVGALAVLGAAVIVGLPTLAGTQPGQGSSDIMAAALLLSAVALLAAGGLEPAPLVVAGAGLGLAVATKLSVLSLGGVLYLGIVLLCVRRGRATLAAGWSVGVIVPALFWAARNVVLADNPLPFFRIRLGPLDLPARATAVGTPSLVDSLPDFDEWQSWYSNGITAGFGRAWPVVLALVVAGALVGVWRGPAVLRVVAAAVIAGLITYPLTPYTGAESFQFNLRILTPTMIVALPLLAVATPRRGSWSRAVAVALGLLVLLNLTAPHHERVAAWPGYPLVAAVAAAGVLTGALVLARPGIRWPEAHRGLVVGSVGLLVLSGFWVQARYHDRRYADAGLDDAALNDRFRGISGQDVDVLGTVEVYPYFGADLSNRVTDHSASLNTSVTVPEGGDPCVTFRARLSPGDRYIVVSSFGFLLRRFPPDERARVFEADPAVTTIYRDAERALYRVDGDLDPSTC